MSFEREVLAEAYSYSEDPSTGKLICQALNEDGCAHKASYTLLLCLATSFLTRCTKAHMELLQQWQS